MALHLSCVAGVRVHHVHTYYADSVAAADWNTHTHARLDYDDDVGWMDWTRRAPRVASCQSIPVRDTSSADL